MEFDNNKAIYLQIYDAICEQILSGQLDPDGRIPSVREYGAEIGVNPNTIMRTYEKLTAEICTLFENELGIDGSSVYVTYHPVSDWGWNGTNF